MKTASKKMKMEIALKGRKNENYQNGFVLVVLEKLKWNEIISVILNSWRTLYGSSPL
jgi:hypothetical protein